LALFVWAYNTVVARKNQVENAFGAVEAQLKRRRDLIPNLVGAVKAYMVHPVPRFHARQEEEMGAGGPGKP
jgi:LemA protein